MKIIFLNIFSSTKKTGLFLLVFTLFIFLFYRSVHDIEKSIVNIELISEKYKSRIVINERNTMLRLGEFLTGSPKKHAALPEHPQYKMIIHLKSGDRIFCFNDPARVHELKSGDMYVLGDKGKILFPWLEKLKNKAMIGEFVSWNQAKNIFKKYDSARVIDIETGMSFNVQRRAGSKHADVQPLTAADSAIMKKIYGGKWSWKRRAVLVELKGKRLAGSMNGMPHGAGAIRGNAFNGHFCIHFRDSELHSNRKDLAHQIMVWKAAGVIEEMLAKASPDEILKITLKYMEQGDYKSALSLIQEQCKGTDISPKLNSFNWIITNEITKPIITGENAICQAKVSYGLNNGYRANNVTLNIKMEKTKEKIPWKVDGDFINQMLEHNKK